MHKYPPSWCCCFKFCNLYLDISDIFVCAWLSARSQTPMAHTMAHNCKWVGQGQVRSACTPWWQPCVRAQETLYKKRHYHYLPVMKATNSASKRCQVSVDVSFQSPSCFQRTKARTFSSQAKGGRPHRLLLGGVQSKQRRNHLCGGNVLMYAANFQYLIVTTGDHGKNANWCTTVSMRACHDCRITCQGADQSIRTGGRIMRRSIFRISMSYLRTSLGYSVRWPAAKQATGVITALKSFRRKPSGMF